MASIQSCFSLVVEKCGRPVFVFISPILVILYLLCWIRAKLTSLFYSNKKQILMTGEDAFTGLEINSNNNFINIVILTKDHFTVEDMKDLTLTKVINARDANNKPLFPKITCRQTLHAGYLMWSEENNFNIDDHITPYRGQPPHDEAELKSLINHLCNNTISPSKPGWEILVIPVEYIVPQTCILFRVHHCMADGISIFRLIIEQMAGNHGAFQHILKRMENKFQSTFRNTFSKVLDSLNQIIYKSIITPTVICSQVFSKDRHFPQNIKLSGIKIFDWTSAIKMSTIIDIRNATSTTVNDVIMSCLAGAFNKFFMKQGVCPPEFLHSAIPINFQGADDPLEMKNNFLAVTSQLPTGDMDCIQRLKTTKAIMDKLKSSPDIIANRWFIQNCVNIIPYTITKWLIDIVHVNVVLSNLPGPANEASFNGHKIKSLFPLAQIRSTTDVGVSVYSYSGHMTVSVTVDKAIINNKEDVRSLLDDFVDGMQQLYNTVKEVNSNILEKEAH